MLGSDILLNCLETHGVNTVFGMPGGVILPLYDRLKNFPNLKHILTRQEQGAVHAADGYARATGEVGVCFATAGAGAANLLTGIATAYMDSVPLVCIVGQAVVPAQGLRGFQEPAMTGAAQFVCKHTYFVKEASELPDVLTEAFFVAKTGRPGPVIVEVPKGVLQEDAMVAYNSGSVRNRIVLKYKPCSVNREKVIKTVKLIKDMKKPLLLLGGGINSDFSNPQTLLHIAEKGQIPVVTTLMARGLFPKKSEYDLGMAGICGTRGANYAVQNCDCLIAIGVRFDDRFTSKVARFAPNAKKIVHVDVDSSEVGKVVETDCPIVVDGTEFINALEDAVHECDHSAWLEELAEQKQEEGDALKTSLPVKEVYKAIDSVVDDKTIVVTDAGLHQMWAALLLHPEGARKFITPGGMGTAGFGLPAAIGAQIGFRDYRVLLVTGDMSLQRNMQELAVLKALDLPIKILLINNESSGLLHQLQEQKYEENYEQTVPEFAPNWDKIAEAYEINYLKVEKKSQCDKKLKKALEGYESLFVEFQISAEETVSPLLVSGEGLLDARMGGDEDEA